ncbi:MAG: hypothetical protein HY738_17065 [Bacteroidia bacterium]|nr:hypothetical protein [Bacteroidia bacterium]
MLAPLDNETIHESIHNPEHPIINTNKSAIKKVAEIIDEDKITPEERNNAKIDESRRIAKEIYIKFAKRERDVEIAKKLIIKGHPNEIIKDATDFSDLEIDNIRKELNDK